MRAVATLVVTVFSHIAAAGTNAFGLKFLEENKVKTGVITLPSGLQYKVLREGDGEAHPLRDTQCKCHYEGRTAQEHVNNGKKFDSSYDRGSPTSFAPSGVIGGWTEAMQLMVEGDKWEMYIPSELGYGDSGQGGDIGAGDVLVFTMEIIKIEGESRPAEPKGPPPYTELVDTESLTAWETSAAASSTVKVICSLKQPIANSKVFQGFKVAARASVKAGRPTSFAIAANSKYVKRSYTPDPVADALKLDPQSIYVAPASADGGWTKCKVGRPSETTAEQIALAVDSCVHVAAAGATNKAEL